MPTWEPKQYLQFADQRTQPCRDLVARISVENPKTLIDLGCGPGNSTAILRQRFPTAKILGLDSSTQMIEAARKSHSDGQWIVENINNWTQRDEAQFDLVFSNAAMQWVPDHERVLPRLLSRVAPGGALAVQVPGNYDDSPAHIVMRDLASSSAWNRRLPPDKVRDWHVHKPAFYYDALAPHCAQLDLWQTEYLHIMSDAGQIVEWYKGTGLRPFLDALADDEKRAEFTADYLREIRRVYLPQGDGKVLFPFRRLFFIAYAV